MSSAEKKDSDLGLSLDEIFQRVMEASGAANDTQLAEAISAGRSSISTWRTRGTIPFENLFGFARKRGVSIHWLLTGEGEKDVPAKMVKAQILMVRDAVLDDPAAAAERQKRQKPSAKNSVGARLRQIRAVMKTDAWAQQMGITAAEVGRLERNEVAPTADFLVKLNETHSIQPLWVLTGRGNISDTAEASHAAAAPAPEPAVTTAEAFNPELMVQIVQMIVQKMQRLGRLPDPEALAKTCVAIYEFARASGTPPAESAVTRLLETMK
jgi:hypothetical protein